MIQVAERWPADTVAHGKDLYLEFCGRCHGLNTHASNIVPDLRRSAALADARTWRAIVEEGSLAANGMIAWKPLMPEGAAEMIRAYVAEQAREGSAAGP
jgi:mono/diheme cytochrome c family protein